MFLDKEVNCAEVIKSPEVEEQNTRPVVQLSVAADPPPLHTIEADAASVPTELGGAVDVGVGTGVAVGLGLGVGVPVGFGVTVGLGTGVAVGAGHAVHTVLTTVAFANVVASVNTFIKSLPDLK